MREINYKMIWILLTALSVISVAVYYVYSRMMHKTFFDFLVWNLFLAWIPFVVAVAIAALNRNGKVKHRLTTVLLSLVWLLFFPNAPYIVTDVIHLTVLKAGYAQSGRLTIPYWYDLLLILLFAWSGVLLGFISTYQIHLLIYKTVNKLVGWLFIAVISMLGAYGILLGREYRLNSWDVITDSKAIWLVLQQSLNVHAVVFCLLFGIVIAVVYVTLYVLLNGGGRANENK